MAREPRPGAPNFRERVRNLVAPAVEPGKVALSWSLLPEDPPGVGFNVYRARRRSEEGFRRNAEPVRGAAAFEDGDVEGGGTWSYRVRPVGPDGPEHRRAAAADRRRAGEGARVPGRPRGGAVRRRARGAARAGAGADGRFAIHVATNPVPPAARQVTARADRHYRLWLTRNLIGGYGTYCEPAR